MSRLQSKLSDEYQDFISSSQVEVPLQLKTQTREKVLRYLSPSALMVFIKILLIHSLTGFLSLSICHQFGLNPFHTQRSLSDWFTFVGGHHVCMLCCGVLFVGVSVLASGYFLSHEEVKVLRRYDLLQNAALCVISLAAFAAFGAELIAGMALLWFVGGAVGGLAAMAAVFKLKGIARA